MIGSSHNDVLKAIIYDTDKEKTDMNYTKDSTLYIMCQSKSEGNTYVYYFTNDICDTYVIVYLYEKMNMVIGGLNEKFVKKEEYKWIDYGLNNYLIELNKLDKFFSLTITKIK